MWIFQLITSNVKAYNFEYSLSDSFSHWRKNSQMQKNKAGHGVGSETEKVVLPVLLWKVVVSVGCRMFGWTMICVCVNQDVKKAPVYRSIAYNCYGQPHHDNTETFKVAHTHQAEENCTHAQAVFSLHTQRKIRSDLWNAEPTRHPLALTHHQDLDLPQCKR